MKSFTINTRASSNLFALTVIALGATLLFTSRTAHTQQLQQGVSVQMAATSTAAAMPEADKLDAWIVAVTADGNVYFGVDPVTPSDLADKMKSIPRRRDQSLYIKADARAPFATIRKVLAAAHEVSFNAAVFLTSQAESPAPGVMVPPTGLEVQIGPHSNAATIVVQVNAAQPSPTFQVNDQDVPAAALQDTLKRLLQDRSDMPVLVKSHGPVSFGPVIRVIDTCHSIGAKVMLSTPEL
jgi:biopolymer transport protein ExbD